MKIPKARQLASGSWFIQLRLKDEYGEVQNISITRPSKKECEQEAAAIKYGLKKALPKGAEMTLRDAIDEYINRRRNTLSPSTIAGYKTIQNCRFQSVMDKRVKDISNWQRICDQEARRYSPKTVRNSYRFIVSVLADCDVQAERVTLPALSTNTRQWLEPEEIRKLVASVSGTKNELYVFFALHSLRRSEIAAMRWENIDLDRRTITVKGAAVYDENGKVVYKTANKNAASARTIPIMIPEMEAALRNVWQKEGPVFDCSVKAIHERINRACRDAGIPEVGTHGLRHSFASLAYHLGMSEVETMEIGGWSDASTMRKIYTHLAASDRLKAENKLRSFFSQQNANENANED